MKRRYGIVLAVVAICALTFGMVGAQASTSAKKSKAVKVKLFEFEVKPKPKSFAAGKIKFVAKNIGTEEHEMVIVRADDAAELPVDENGGVVEDEIDEADLPGEIEEFAKGTKAKKSFDLEAGTYILFCNITEEEEAGPLNHFNEGMYTTFTVT